MEEVWKDIKDYEGHYQVSNLGRVKSVSRTIQSSSGKITTKDLILKPKNNIGGYLVVNLNKDGSYKTKFVHRLVAETFIPNPNNLPQINHKDENKNNNFVENLEWCTSKYNANYGTRNIRASKNKMKRVAQYDLEGNFIRHWESISTVQRETGMRLSGISGACLGINKTAYGYLWRYCNE